MVKTYDAIAALLGHVLEYGLLIILSVDDALEDRDGSRAVQAAHDVVPRAGSFLLLQREGRLIRYQLCACAWMCKTEDDIRTRYESIFCALLTSEVGNHFCVSTSNLGAMPSDEPSPLTTGDSSFFLRVDVDDRDTTIPRPHGE